MLNTGISYKTVRALTNCDVAQWTTMDMQSITKDEAKFQQVVRELYKVELGKILFL